eukprot:NODE_5680_length_983_cov_43.117442_g5101_i0.p1 GENE.NODE_5680_length_983_cov_43.117442_g5101_i0~~NODE_5680_length_983_cov_43.117442_g5101_i0.p1  ORF type:complete len:262 (-),score=28.63 NODE_5680_length_983_cov_43.117442_g5101_i0:136-921(-)
MANVPPNGAWTRNLLQHPLFYPLHAGIMFISDDLGDAWTDLTSIWGTRVIFISLMLGIMGFILLGKTVVSLPVVDSAVLLNLVLLDMLHVMVALMGIAAGWRKNVYITKMFVWGLSLDIMLFIIVTILLLDIHTLAKDPFTTIPTYIEILWLSLCLYIGKTFLCSLKMEEAMHMVPNYNRAVVRSEQSMLSALAQDLEMEELHPIDATPPSQEIINRMATQLNVSIEEVISTLERNRQDVVAATSALVLKRRRTVSIRVGS